MDTMYHRVELTERNRYEGPGALLLRDGIVALHGFGHSNGDGFLESRYVPASGVEIIDEPTRDIKSLTLINGLQIFVLLALYSAYLSWKEGGAEVELSRLPLALVCSLGISFIIRFVLSWRRLRYNRYKIYLPGEPAGLEIAIRPNEQTKLDNLIADIPEFQIYGDLKPVVIRHRWWFLYPANRAINSGLLSLFVAFPLFLVVVYFGQRSDSAISELQSLVGVALALSIVPGTMLVSGLVLRFKLRKRGPQFSELWEAFKAGQYENAPLLLRQIAERDRFDAEVAQFAAQLYWDAGEVEEAQKWAQIADRQSHSERDSFSEEFNRLVNWAA